MVLGSQAGPPVISFDALPKQMTFLDPENDFKATPSSPTDTPEPPKEPVPRPSPFLDANFFLSPPLPLEEVVAPLTAHPLPLATNQQQVTAPPAGNSCCIIIIILKKHNSPSCLSTTSVMMKQAGELIFIA